MSKQSYEKERAANICRSRKNTDWERIWGNTLIKKVESREKKEKEEYR
jgi:hypothetical protein